MARFTILGATGFIGSHLANYLVEKGDIVTRLKFDDAVAATDLGHVIYCIGLTADFRSRPFDAMDAHVNRVGEFLRNTHVQSFLYLSSTRVYGGASTTRETAKISVDPSSPSDLYNISKLAGEALCLSHDDPAIRVARLSNVFGDGAGGAAMAPDNFLASIIQSAVANGHIPLMTALDSCKDYIAVDDAVRALRVISLRGGERLYNVAAGSNTGNDEITREIGRNTGCSVSVVAGAPTSAFPVIDTTRLRAEFDAAGKSWNPAPVTDCLVDLVAHYRPESAKLAGGLK